jgi:hypothetical protein
MVAERIAKLATKAAPTSLMTVQQFIQRHFEPEVVKHLTRQGLKPLISLRDMEVRSQESEVRMAAAYALSIRLTSSSMFVRPTVSP